MGKTVVIDEKKKYLDCKEYFKNGIDNLIIKEGVKEIERYAFAQNNITNLTIPNSITRIYYAAFDGNPITELTFYFKGTLLYISDSNFLDVLTLNVINGNYDFLEQFFRYIEICDDNFKKLESIILVNDKLTFSEKIKIRKLSMIKRIQIRFATDITRFNVAEEDSTQEISVDEEVNNLLKEINLLSKGLDEQSSNIIQMKVTKLLDEYNKNLVNLKPDYYQEEQILTLECTNPRDLRNNLIISLNNVIMLLNSRKKILNLSTKITQYNEFFMYDKNIEVNDDNNFKKISKIKELDRIFKNKFLVAKVAELLLNIKMQINNNLDNLFNDKLDLTNLDIPSYFDSELDKIYQQALFLIPYENMLMNLELKGDSKLATDLNNLNDIFSKVNSEIFNPLFSKYQELLKKYITIIKNSVTDIFNNQEFLSAKQIETNFRQELNVILEELKKELPKILENQELLNDIFLAKEYMDSRCGSDNWLISVIKEILNLTNNNLLDDAIAKCITTRLGNLLEEWYLSLSNKSINNIVESLNNNYDLTSDVLIVKTKIISDFYEIKSEVESYLARLEEYEKYNSLVISKKQTIQKTIKKENKSASFWDNNRNDKNSFLKKY